MNDPAADLAFLAQRETPCLARLGRENPWSSILALRIGSSYVGVRADSPTTAGLLETAFATHRAPHLDSVAPPNFSVRLSSTTRVEDARPGRVTGPRRLNLVYRNHEVVARRESRGEILRDLVALLESTTYGAVHEHLAIRCSAAVTDSGDVILLPSSWYRLLVPHRRRLANTEGLDLLPGDVHLVDADRGDLVRVVSMRHVDRWPQRSHAIVCWGMLRDSRAPHLLRRSQGVHAGVPTIVNMPTIGPGKALRDLGRLSRQVNFVALPAASASAAATMASTLAAVARDDDQGTLHSPSLTATAVGGELPPRGQ